MLKTTASINIQPFLRSGLIQIHIFKINPYILLLATLLISISDSSCVRINSFITSRAIEVMHEKEVDLKNPPFENIAERWMKNYASQRYVGKTLDNYHYVLNPILEFFTGIKIKNISLPS